MIRSLTISVAPETGCPTGSGGCRCPHAPARSTSRACATAARSGSTASGSTTSPSTRRSRARWASLAAVYDLQHEAADDCLVPDPETGEPINVSHLIPRSRDDLDRRHRAPAAHRRVHGRPHGAHARLPERHLRGLRGARRRVGAATATSEGAANLVAFQDELARRDLVADAHDHPSRPSTRASATSRAGRRRDRAAQGRGHRARHRRSRRPRPVDARAVRRRARRLPRAAAPEGRGRATRSRSRSRWTTPGLQGPVPRQLLARRDRSSTTRSRPASTSRTRSSSSTTSRCRATASSSTATSRSTTRVMVTGWAANVMQQTTIRAARQARVRVRARDAHGRGGERRRTPTTKQMLGELWTYAELDARRVCAAEAGRVELGQRHVVLRRAPVPRAAPDAPAVVPPRERDPEAPRLAQPARHADRGRARRSDARGRSSTATSRAPSGARAEERIRLFRAAWDFVGSALGGRNELYERFYLASARAHTSRSRTWSRSARRRGSRPLVDRCSARAESMSDSRDVAGVAVATDHWIGGERVASASGERFAVHSPIDGAHLADVAAGGAGRRRRRRRAARAAFPAWAALGPKGARRVLLRFADGIRERLPETRGGRDRGQRLAAARERPRKSSTAAAHNIEFFADWSRSTLEHERSTDPRCDNDVRYEPAGVAALITPWNAPLMLSTWKVGPALAAGNTVVLKPPEWAPLTCSLLADIAADGRACPPACSTSCRASARRPAPRSSRIQDVDRISFTGSPDTARLIAAAGRAEPHPGQRSSSAASRRSSSARTPISTPPPRTVAGQYVNAGQVCLAGTRVLVEASIADEFLANGCAAAVDRLPVGDPREPRDARRSADHRRALRAGRRASSTAPSRRAHGALWGGGPHARGGLYFAPTLLDRRPPGHGDRPARGVRPGAHVADVPTDDEVVDARPTARATGSPRRSSPRDEAPGASHRRRGSCAGTVWVNCFFVRDLARAVRRRARSPGSAAKAATWSFDFFCDVKNVAIREAIASARGRQRWVRSSARRSSDISRRSCCPRSSASRWAADATRRSSTGFARSARAARRRRRRHARHRRHALVHDVRARPRRARSTIAASTRPKRSPGSSATTPSTTRAPRSSPRSSTRPRRRAACGPRT